jgi:hypothetical protein
MNRLALLIALLGMTAANACLAEDPAFCKSMCASEQRACHANAQLQPREERLMPSDTPDKNPFARTAQGEVQTSGMRALDASGNTNRRLARGSSCDSGYQACTRACQKPQNADGAKARHEPVHIG